jgi:transcriptional regulator
MYTPKVYAAPDDAYCHALIRSYPFALLVSCPDGLILGSHIPFLLDADRGRHGTLLGHVARANPQWRRLEEQEVMVAFSGPDAYVSPSWYEQQVTVPTWNYAAVHAYGRPRLVTETAPLLAMVKRLTEEHERRLGSAWTLAQAAPILEQELRGIVGFEVPLDRLEGKVKMNQNRTVADRQGVARALADSPDSRERAIAAEMAGHLEAESAASGDAATAGLRYSATARPPAETIAQLYRDAGLRRPVDDVERLRRTFAGSNVVWTAWQGETLVGALRGWTDGAYDGYVCDLAVHADWQRRGLGRELLARATAGRPEIQWVLRASAVATGYYEHLGWKRIDNGWFQPRER